MQQFKDDKQRVWTLRADTNAVDRITDLAGVDLTHLLDDQDVITHFTADKRVMIQVLWAWCQPEIAQREVTPEDFGGSLYESFDDAFDAVLKELPFFFPKHRRELATRLVERFLEAEAQGAQRAIDLLQSDQMSGLVNKAIDKAVQQGLAMAETRIDGDARSTGSQGSSESTLDP